MTAIDDLPPSAFLRHGTALGFYGGVAYLAVSLIADWRGMGTMLIVLWLGTLIVVVPCIIVGIASAIGMLVAVRLSQPMSGKPRIAARAGGSAMGAGAAASAIALVFSFGGVSLMMIGVVTVVVFLDALVFLRRSRERAPVAASAWKSF
ncbi:hypothetical protein BH09ACT1_BH09ACT1_29710 [soil metagenome]